MSHSADRDIRRLVRRGAQALIGLLALAGNAAAQDYPRLANLYLHGSVDPRVIPDLARWDLLVLNAVWSQRELDQLRRLNPDIKLFLYVCAYCVEMNPPTPNSWGRENTDYASTNDLWWYNRNRTVASDWPGSRMVNITAQAPRGAQGSWREFIAQRITMLMQERPAADGVFLDNYWRSLSWNQGALQLDSDCNPTHNRAGCDGVMDDNATLDARWNQALRVLAADVRRRFDILEAGRARPLALLSNSATDYHKWLNGTLWEFFPQGGGRKDPGNVYGYNWLEPMLARPNGYLEAPFSSDPYRVLVVNAVMGGTRAAPNRTADSERHKRFTLASTLLGDGYYSLDAGQVLGHGQLWWEPEYDHAGRGTGYLGQPTSPPYRIAAPSGPEQVTNGDFSRGYIGWRKLNEGATGKLTIDAQVFRSAPASGRIDVHSVGAGSLKVWQSALRVRANTAYTLSFWARSSRSQRLLVHLYSDACTNKRCMQDTYVEVGPHWEEYALSFVSPNDAVAGFNLFVSQVSSVWVDDLSLRQGDSNVFRRDFANGTVLLNYSSTTQMVELGGLYRRLEIPGSAVFTGHIVRREAVGPSDAQILLYVGEDPSPAPPPVDSGNRLLQNEPNPFNPSTRIRFSLEQTSPVALTILSVAGRRVRTLIDGVMPGNTHHEVIWNGDDDLQQPVASGVYFYQLQTPAYTDVRKMTLIR